MSTSLQSKICIVGAGPAGATTSLFLSKMKIPHMIVDASTFPRDKVCGDALDLKVMRVLNYLDADIVKNEILPNPNFAKAGGCRIVISKNVTHNLVLPKQSDDAPYPFFFISKRAYFDNFLFNKLKSDYAEIHTGIKIKDVKKTGDGWRLLGQGAAGEVEIKTDFVIGADGDHSAVLRGIGARKINRQNYAAALRQYWKGVTGLHADNYLEVYLPKSLPLAYLWIFPLPNGEANVGCGLLSDIIQKQSVDLKKLLKQLITEDETLADRFKHATPLESPVGWGLPLASEGKNASGDGYLLVGDAASLVCPTTGEGVGPGMMSGYIAARFIERAYNAGKYDELMFRNYTREINKRLKTDVKKFRLIKKVSPILYNNLINKLSAWGVAQFYFDKRGNNWVKTAKRDRIKVEMD